MSRPSYDTPLIVLDAKFTIPYDRQAPALAALKEQAEDFEDSNSEELQAARTLPAALAALSWNALLDVPSRDIVGIEGGDGLTMSTDNNLLFEEVLAPYIARGSSIVVVGGNAACWCWSFDGDGCEVGQVALAI